MRFFYVIFWSLLSSWSLSAQELSDLFNVQYYGVEEGLSHRAVESIAQDNQGVIWIGTKYGLNRFDGYNFKWFTKEKNGLASNIVAVILKDQEGLFWLLEIMGSTGKEIKNLTLFDPLRQKVVPIEEKFKEGLPFALEDVMLNEEKEGTLTFITRKNQIYNYTNEWTVIPFQADKFQSFSDYHQISEDKFWLIGQTSSEQHSFLIFNDKGQILKEEQYSGDYLEIYEANINGSGRMSLRAKDAYQGAVRIGYDDKLFKITPDNQVIEDNDSYLPKISKNDYSLSILDRIVSNSEYYFLLKFKKFIVADKATLTTQIDIGQYYPDVVTTHKIFIDKKDNIWLGTQFGVYHLIPKKTVFKNYFHGPSDNDDYFFACRGITLDQNNQLWTYCENFREIWNVNLNTGIPKHVIHENTTDGNYRDMLTLSNGQVYYSIGYDFWYNPLTNSFDTQTKEQPFREVWANYEDKKGRIWFADQSSNELGYVTKEGRHIIDAKLSTTENLFVYQFFEIPNSDKLWLVTDGGLFLFNIENLKIEGRYWKEGEGNFNLPVDKFYHLYHASDDTYWIGTIEDGLIHLKWENEQFQIIEQFTRADGLPSNAIYAVYGDDYDNLWLATGNGLSQFNTTSKSFRGYTTQDGISHNEFNRLSHYKAKDGTIYFGTLRGITSFHPKDLVGDSISTTIPLTITSFQQFDGRQNKLVNRVEQIVQTKRITIRPNDRFFRLEFALLTYEATNKIQYAYQIEGVDKDWNYQSENVLRLSRLPYGNHQLIIKGQLPNGQWSTQQLILKIRVLRPFYLQWWFILLLLGAIVGGIYFYNKNRTRSLLQRQTDLENKVEERTKQIRQDKVIIEKQAKELRQLDKTKSRFFANVSHELRTPITLLLGPLSSIEKSKQLNQNNLSLLKIAQNSSKNLLRLVNEILDLSKLENSKLELHEEPQVLFLLVRRVIAAFESHAERRGIDFYFQFNLEKTLQISVDADKFEKILNNLLSNAFKFTEKGGQVKVTVSDLGHNLHFEVSDTGRGIHPDDINHIFDRYYQTKRPDAVAEGGTGIGLAMCKEIASLFNGKVWVKSQLSKGSVFFFEMPRNEVIKSISTTDARAIQQGVQPNSKNTIAQSKNILKQNVQNNSTILIVEDNQSLRDYLKNILEKYYSVITAENGEEALKRLTADSRWQTENRPLSLILSDVMMPIMDGFQLLDKVKNDEKLRHLPFIMLTARAEVSDKIKALRIGVDDYLTKPFEEEELLVRIENLIQNYQNRLAFQDLAQPKTNGIKKPEIAKKDLIWLETLEKTVKTNLSTPNFSVKQIANELNISPSTLRRKIAQLTGLNPQKYIQEIQLQVARTYIEEQRFSSLKETALAVGFSTPAYFTRLFKERFGVLPSEYLK